MLSLILLSFWGNKTSVDFSASYVLYEAGHKLCLQTHPLKHQLMSHLCQNPSRALSLRVKTSLIQRLRALHGLPPSCLSPHLSDVCSPSSPVPAVLALKHSSHSCLGAFVLVVSSARTLFPQMSACLAPPLHSDVYSGPHRPPSMK